MGIQPTRRAILLGGTALTMAAGTAGAATGGMSNAATAVGSVREVMAGTEGEPRRRPVPGVLVSNGRDVVRTDAEGRYELSVEAGQAIFVVKPAGYQVPVDPVTMLPRFSHIYDPGGTPAELRFRYAGMPATGPLPASLDFDLVRVDEPDTFDVVMLTDPQPETAAEIAFIRDDVVAGLIGTKAAFAINCGDIAFNDLSMYPRINRIMGRIGVPMWNIGGNHDLDYEAPDAKRSRDTFKRVFGAPYYALEHGKALFIMLDNVEYLGDARRDEGAGYRGFVSRDQLAFVENLLEQTPRDRLIVLAMHITLKNRLVTKAQYAAVPDPNLPLWWR